MPAVQEIVRYQKIIDDFLYVESVVRYNGDFEALELFECLRGILERHVEKLKR